MTDLFVTLFFSGIRRPHLHIRCLQNFSSSYSTAYTNDEFPVEVTLNDYMYFEYSVESTADLVVFALTVKATPEASFYSSPHYSIVENG